MSERVALSRAGHEGANEKDAQNRPVDQSRNGKCGIEGGPLLMQKD